MSPRCVYRTLNPSRVFSWRNLKMADIREWSWITSANIYEIILKFSVCWHDFSLWCNQKESNNARIWSVLAAEAKNPRRWEGEVVSGGRAEWSSSGFNVNMNFTHGSILCIYLHAQREKRCVQRRSQETGTEVRRLKIAPLISRHFTDEGIVRQCFYAVLLVRLQHWQQSSIKVNVWLLTKLIYLMKYLLLLNYNCWRSHEAVLVGRGCDTIFASPAWADSCGKSLKCCQGCPWTTVKPTEGPASLAKVLKSRPELCFNTSVELLLVGRWGDVDVHIGSLQVLQLPPTLLRRGKFRVTLGVNLGGKDCLSSCVDDLPPSHTSFNHQHR